jgi:hypothetical protein
MNKIRLLAVALVLCLMSALGDAAEAPKKGRTLSLIYSNNINAEVDPCPT